MFEKIDLPDVTILVVVEVAEAIFVLVGPVISFLCSGVCAVVADGNAGMLGSRLPSLLCLFFEAVLPIASALKSMSFVSAVQDTVLTV